MYHVYLIDTKPSWLVIIKQKATPRLEHGAARRTPTAPTALSS